MRVLHVMRSLEAGGIGTFILNVYRKIDTEKIQFDFAITHDGMGQYGQEIIEKGGNIYFISRNGNRSMLDGVMQIKNLFKLCKQNKYDVVHTHYYFANAYFLLAARLAGIKKRVSHCHNTRTKKVGFLKRLFELASRFLLLHVGTDFLGCSTEATLFLYGKSAFDKGKAKVLYNGIDYNYWDPNHYDYNSSLRELNLLSKNNVIFVGRFEEQKNPLFALKIINEAHKNVSDLYCNFIGYGSLSDEIKSYISENNMQSFIRLLSPDTDIRVYQAVSKVMVAPSLWEGLSIAFIEAQKMKTYVIASDQVPNEVDMGYCSFIPLSDERAWVDKICKLILDESKEHGYNDKYELFNVENTVKNLINVYNS